MISINSKAIAIRFSPSGGDRRGLKIPNREQKTLNGTTSYFTQFDGNGTVLALVRGSDGLTAAVHEYGPLGNMLRNETFDASIALDDDAKTLPDRLTISGHAPAQPAIVVMPHRSISRQHASLGSCLWTAIGYIGRMDADPILYIKRGCPYCRAAAAFFSTHGVPVEIRDVSSSRTEMKRLVEVTEQGEVPTFICGDFVVSGFDVDELLDELAERPDIRLRLGLGDHDDEL